MKKNKKKNIYSKCFALRKKYTGDVELIAELAAIAFCNNDTIPIYEKLILHKFYDTLQLKKIIAELLEVNEEKVHANFTVNTTYTRAPILTVSIDK